ncbi:MAG: hypothetical protein QOI95_3458 [Acidimicrobiaceae bacterium]|jgi:drug/metabolite transporter (DMT)-like permease
MTNRGPTAAIRLPAMAFLRSRHVMWLVPVGVFVVVRRGPPERIELACVATTVVGVILLVRARPKGAVIFLLAFAPLQVVILAALYRIGLPEAAVQQLHYWKEYVVAGLALVAARHWAASGRRVDLLDKVLLAYVVGTTLYLLAPWLLGRDSEAVSVYTRSVAWRNLVLYVVLFLVVRHGPFDERTKRRAGDVVLVVGGIMAGVTIFEFLASSSWNQFAVNTLHVPELRRDIFNITTGNPFDLRTYGTVGDQLVVRPGSVVFDPLTAGFDMILPLAVGVERILRNRGRTHIQVVTAACALAILLTQTRSAIIAAAAVVALAIAALPGRSEASRARFALGFVAVVIVLVPITISTGVAARVLGGDSTSTEEHRARLLEGLDTVAREPLGLGLGTAPDSNQRLERGRPVITENYYLQVAVEVGVLNMGLFMTLVFLMLRGTKRATRGDESALTGAVFAAGVGLSVGGLFLHVWAGTETALVYWAAAGLAIAGPDRSPAVHHLYDRRRRTAIT